MPGTDHHRMLHLSIPAVQPVSEIPRIIHQTYHTKALPSVIAANVQKILAQNPGWEHRLYDDDDMAAFVESAYGQQISAFYSRINPKYGAARADLFRYLIMYSRGGVYLDIKASLEKPLDDVLRPGDVYILSRWRNRPGEAFEGWGKHRRLRHVGGDEFQQWHIIAAPGHPFLMAVIECVICNIQSYNPILWGTGKTGVLRLTGPIPYTLAITPLLQHHPHRMADATDDLGLTYSIFPVAEARAHRRIFKHHYTDLTESVVQLDGIKRLAWQLFGPVQNQVLRRVRNVVQRAYWRSKVDRKPGD